MADDGSDDSSKPKSDVLAALLAQSEKFEQVADNAAFKAWFATLKSKQAPAATQSPIDQIEAFIPTTKIPGYWDSLAENARTWAGEVSISKFWRKVANEISEWRTEYERRTEGATLIAGDQSPHFVGKAMPRLREKVEREVNKSGVANVFVGGSVVPAINDLVRVRISTSYLDGVDFLAERLERSLRDSRLNVASERQQRLRGYYAAHISVEHDVLFRFDTSHHVKIACEIQIATELSTTIWDRTHGAYELARTLSSDNERDWMWNPDDPRFLAAQLAHMIHLADGLIVQLREKTKRKKGDL